MSCLSSLKFLFLTQLIFINKPLVLHFDRCFSHIVADIVMEAFETVTLGFCSCVNLMLMTPSLSGHIAEKHFKSFQIISTTNIVILNLKWKFGITIFFRFSMSTSKDFQIHTNSHHHPSQKWSVVIFSPSRHFYFSIRQSPIRIQICSDNCLI